MKEVQHILLLTLVVYSLSLKIEKQSNLQEWHTVKVGIQDSHEEIWQFSIMFIFLSMTRCSPAVSSQHKVEEDRNAYVTNRQTSETAPAPRGLNSSGNFSVSALFNAHFGARPPFMGSSWNIFGVPTYVNKDSSSAHYLHTRRTQQRHHPFWQRKKSWKAFQSYSFKARFLGHSLFLVFWKRNALEGLCWSHLLDSEKFPNCQGQIIYLL